MLERRMPAEHELRVDRCMTKLAIDRVEVSLPFRELIGKNIRFHLNHCMITGALWGYGLDAINSVIGMETHPIPEPGTLLLLATGIFLTQRTRRTTEWGPGCA